MEILSSKNKNLKHYGDRIDLDKNSQSISDKKNYSISLRINTLLYDTLHHYLLAMHNVSDYKFSSISDVLRHIITQIAEKGFSTDQLIQDKASEYTEVIIRVTRKQKIFWKDLPDRNKRKIMERAIVAFTKNELQ